MQRVSAPPAAALGLAARAQPCAARALAAGCSTSRSFRIVAPSFVTVTSPTSSTSICRRARFASGVRCCAAALQLRCQARPRRGAASCARCVRRRARRAPPGGHSARRWLQEDTSSADRQRRRRGATCLVEAHGAERALHDVGDRGARIHCGREARARRRVSASGPEGEGRAAGARSLAPGDAPFCDRTSSPVWRLPASCSPLMATRRNEPKACCHC